MRRWWPQDISFLQGKGRRQDRPRVHPSPLPLPLNPSPPTPYFWLLLGIPLPPFLDTWAPTPKPALCKALPQDICAADSFSQLVTKLKLLIPQLLSFLALSTSSCFMLWIMYGTSGTQERPFIKSVQKRIHEWFWSTKSLLKWQRATQACREFELEYVHIQAPAGWEGWEGDRLWRWDPEILIWIQWL